MYCFFTPSPAKNSVSSTSWTRTAANVFDASVTVGGSTALKVHKQRFINVVVEPPHHSTKMLKSECFCQIARNKKKRPLFFEFWLLKKGCLFSKKRRLISFGLHSYYLCRISICCCAVRSRLFYPDADDIYTYLLSGIGYKHSFVTEQYFTVDGRNPAPVDTYLFSDSSEGFYTSELVSRFLNHQQLRNCSCQIELLGKLQKVSHANVWLRDQFWRIRWMFPKIVVPPNHPFLIGFSIINHPFWGTTIFGNTQISQSVHLPTTNRQDSVMSLDVNQ